MKKNLLSNGAHNISSWFKNTDKPYLIEWLALSAVIFLAAISYTYYDILVTTRGGIDVWNLLFRGEIHDFYSVTGSAYDFSIYAIFAVWDFPLWAAEKLLGINATENVLCLIWSKMMLLLFISLSASTLMKIAKQLKLGDGTSKWLIFVWLSSVLLGSSTLVASQYDIITVLFMLCGFLAFLRKEDKKFLLFFAIAVSCKYFAFLVFVPLLLLRRKKILQIVFGLLVSMSISIALKLLFYSPGTTVSGVGLPMAIGSIFFSWTVPLGMNYGYVFLISMAALCIWCYAQPETDTVNVNNAIFASAAAMLAFVVESPIFPYWSVLATPFLSILIFSNSKHFKLNLFLEMAASACVLLQQMERYYWVFCNKVVQPMLWGRVFTGLPDEKLTKGIGSFITRLEEGGIPVLQGAASIAICCAVGLLLLNLPKKQTLRDAQESIINVERSVMWFRAALFTMMTLIPLAYFVRDVMIYA